MIVMKNKQPTLPLDQPAQQHPGVTLQKKKGVGALAEAPLSACTCDTETQTRLDTTVLRQRPTQPTRTGENTTWCRNGFHTNNLIHEGSSPSQNCFHFLCIMNLTWLIGGDTSPVRLIII